MPDTDEDHFSDDEASSEYPDTNDLRADFGNVFMEMSKLSCGHFFMSEQLTQAPNPYLQISELGVVGLPLSKRDAEAVVSFAKQQSFGPTNPAAGKEVACNEWEIDSRRISFANPEWEAFIQGHVYRAVCAALAVRFLNPRPRLELSALLIYHSGPRLSRPPNVRTPDNMFASITITLPSEYTGGEVQVSYANTTEVLDFSRESLITTTLLAWYSNAGHEVKPVTSGYRFALSYNLIYDAPPGVVKPSYSARNEEEVALRRVLTRWQDGDYAIVPETPFLVYILEDDDNEDSYRIKVLHQIAE